MKLKTKIGITLAIISLASGVQAASVIGSINFSSGPGGGVILQDSAGNVTTNLALAFGIKEWQLPKVEVSSGSFMSVPNGESVVFSQPWVFDPSTPMTPLWSIPGFGDFTFSLASSTIEFRDSNFLLISGSGTITGSNFEATPATWTFSTQGVATEGKFSWSSTTQAVPESGVSALLATAMLGLCLLRRRNAT
jgi:hypothetical protein